MRSFAVLVGLCVLACGQVAFSAEAADKPVLVAVAKVETGKPKAVQADKKVSIPKTTTTDTPVRVWTLEMACCEPQ